MKKNEVKIASTYRAKVGGQLTKVHVTGINPHGGWDGFNLATKRKVRIKSAQQLQGLVEPPTTRPKRKKIVTKAEYEAEAKAERAAKTGKPATKATRTTKATTKCDTGERGATDAKQKRLSGLDAAAKILADATEPLGTTTMVERMLDQGLWTTKGATPAATIYAAIVRDIQKRGDASRFQKTERGKFALRKGA